MSMSLFSRALKFCSLEFIGLLPLASVCSLLQCVYCFDHFIFLLSVFIFVCVWVCLLYDSDYLCATLILVPKIGFTHAHK